MINITQLQPSTVERLKQIYNEYKDIVLHMHKSGTAFEKAVALVILTVGDEESV